MPRKPKLDATECDGCFGCGHVCTRCDFPINACECLDDYGLDTEEMALCSECGGTGSIPPDPPKEVARA